MYCVFGSTEEGATWYELAGRRHASFSSRDNHAVHITESRCVPQCTTRHVIPQFHDSHERVRHSVAARQSGRTPSGHFRIERTQTSERPEYVGSASIAG